MRTLIQLSTSAPIPGGEVHPQFFSPCISACRQFTQVTADGKRAIYLAAVNQIALVSNPGRGAKRSELYANNRSQLVEADARKLTEELDRGQ
jgi:hypothetical protein